MATNATALQSAEAALRLGDDSLPVRPACHVVGGRCDFTPRSFDGGRSLVTGRFYAKDLHGYGGRMLPASTVNWCVE